jgi:16S rRNA (uracil1498-N3)-methyltransferase
VLVWQYNAMARASGLLPPRFLVPDLDPSSGEVRLPREEAHHLARVLRMNAGDTISVFDGRGNEYDARVTTIDRETVAARLTGRHTSAPEPVPPFTIVQAVLKGAAMDDVIRNATMMGAARIEPLLTSHVAVPAAALRRETLERWRRIAVAAVKQCRRATVPRIGEIRRLEEWLATADDELRLLFVEPESGARAVPMRAVASRPRPSHASLIIGPEGGWSAAEIERAVSHACVAVTLGPLTLRAEIAPIAAIAVFTSLWESGTPAPSSPPR